VAHTATIFGSRAMLDGSLRSSIGHMRSDALPSMNS